MWRNVYRLPDGSYEFGLWRASHSGALALRAPAPGIVCVGVVHEPWPKP